MSYAQAAIRRAPALIVAALLGLATPATRAAQDPVPVPSGSVGFSAERLRPLHDYMQHLVDSGALPGAVVALARHGKVVLLETFGQADADVGS